MQKTLRFIVVILALALLGIGLYHILRPNHFIATEKALEHALTPHSSFVEYKEYTLHVIDEGQGETVFLVHGLGGNAREFDDLAPLLAKNYRVLRFDLPGFGVSSHPNAGDTSALMPQLEELMAFMIDSFSKDGSAYVVGNSLGGWISWETAHRYPTKVKKLVLLGSAGYDMPTIAKEATAWLKNPFVRFAIAKGISPSVAKTNVLACTHHDSKIDSFYFYNKYIFSNREGNLDWMIHLATQQVFPDTNHIQEIKTPTLIVWGDKDEIIPYNHASRFYRDLPQATLETYTDCGHVPMIEEPIKLDSSLRAFFTRTDSLP